MADTDETIVEIEQDNRREPAAFLWDRRHPSVTAIIAIVALMLQLGALVWGAATIKSAVDNLGMRATELQVDLHTLQSDVGTLKVDVGILKAREK